MKLSQAKIKCQYTIKRISYDIDYELSVRLNHLGFLEGGSIFVKCMSPIGSSAIVVEIKGALIALSKSEASNVLLDSSSELSA